ncbi:hypothetical protein [Spirosoma rhododendri]|uniref:Uncharacterized protein n=1 Tax=Spirosoma rhododendri TaxID=2728024 RepID=A0A7L5DHL4_9BACT|nr:hypothetical protein [Spirosoma rhododendri]QJD77816.1 hypothetical protein HH216_04780 [Spirosoma rhododendri]
MFDGIKVQDVSVSVDGLLTNDRLTFGGLVDMQMGFVLNPEQRAQDRGLNFRLVPRRAGLGHRVEVKGSLHKFYNNGLHNADQYTANDVLLTLDRLVTEYGFNLYESKINNIEFGVNVELPFAISQVFANLICYKNQPFASDPYSQTPYYTCNRQRYTVKIYDKGKQKGLGCNLLRFEIRVKKMQYFNGTGIRLRTLADLLNVANYGPLGALLVDTFDAILFDDPAISQKVLTPNERTLYKECRNPRYWPTPNNLTPKQAATHRQRMSRSKDRFRALLHQYGSNWQRDVSTLIRQTWAQLTAVDDDLLTQIETYKSAWRNLPKPDVLNGVCSENTVSDEGETCHKLTGSIDTDEVPVDGPTCHELTDVADAGLSRINPLCSEVLCDTGKSDQPPAPPTVCPVTGAVINQPQPGQRFVSAAMLRTNDDLLLTLERQHRQYAKGSKEDEYSRAAHNVRNKESNERNNLRRRIERNNFRQHLEQHSQTTGGQLPLFPEFGAFQLTDAQRAALDYWKGTPYEVKF